MSCIDPLCMNKILRKSMRCFLWKEKKEEEQRGDDNVFRGENGGHFKKERLVESFVSNRH